MYIKNDFDFNDLKENCWSGAIDTLKKIEVHNKEDELIELLESIMGEDVGEIPTMVEVNDFLWMDEDFVLESLGITKKIDFSLYDSFDDYCEKNNCKNCPFYMSLDPCEVLFEEAKSKQS